MLRRFQDALMRVATDLFGGGAYVQIANITQEAGYGRERMLTLEATIIIPDVALSESRVPLTLEDEFNRWEPDRDRDMMRLAAFHPEFRRDVFPMVKIPPLESPSKIPKLPSISVSIMRARLRDLTRERNRRRAAARKKRDAEQVKIAAKCLGNIGRAIELAFQTDHPTLRFSLLEID